MKTSVGIAVHNLLKDPSILPGFRAQFRPHERDEASVARNLNAAFLIAMTGKRLAHPAIGYLSSISENDKWGSIAGFYLQALYHIEEELDGPMLDAAAAAARDLTCHIDKSPGFSDPATLKLYWSLFFPEGAGIIENRNETVRKLIEQRTISVKTLNPAPIKHPCKQILFSSNVLITLPLENDPESRLLTGEMEQALSAAAHEKQVYWYDHPIPVGIDTGRNEAVYGLRAMDHAVRFEIERGNAPADAKVPVLLSISTTHLGLQDLAHEYLASELKEGGGIEHLKIYAAAEKDVGRLLDTILLPAAAHLLPERNVRNLDNVLGVDGEYGRHYSFLKAMAAVWQVLVDGDIKATFKIDLDQVFPQEALVSETGKSAFEHLADPLWGALGIDGKGQDVELGMVAGALVNEADISGGLFTPDVKWPEADPSPDQWTFASTWPQALSTEAEMMTRYGDSGLDGHTSCLQRVHVTGGTTGIMIEQLRRHRPFTPGWIGRAEDQAYLLSVLFSQEGPVLRYAHAAGLIMRHDKEAFATEAMKAARIGKLVGDYIRILTFTSYARALPWKLETIKDAVDPFTGCFISRLPVTVSCLRMSLTAANMFASDTETDIKDGVELVRIGSRRLGEAIEDLCDEAAVAKRLQKEREGWDLYYDLLDALEEELEKGDEFANSIREKARELVEGWRI